MTQNLKGMVWSRLKNMSPYERVNEVGTERKVSSWGHPVLWWMADNILIKRDPAGNHGSVYED